MWKLCEDGYSGLIIVFIVNVMLMDWKKCLEVGCDDFVVKLVDWMEFFMIVVRYFVW